jgi:hypothetical protein
MTTGATRCARRVSQAKAAPGLLLLIRPLSLVRAKHKFKPPFHAAMHDSPVSLQRAKRAPCAGCFAWVLAYTALHLGPLRRAAGPALRRKAMRIGLCVSLTQAARSTKIE